MQTGRMLDAWSEDVTISGTIARDPDALCIIPEIIPEFPEISSGEKSLAVEHSGTTIELHQHSYMSPGCGQTTLKPLM